MATENLIYQQSVPVEEVNLLAAKSHTEAWRQLLGTSESDNIKERIHASWKLGRIRYQK